MKNKQGVLDTLCDPGNEAMNAVYKYLESLDDLTEGNLNEIFWAKLRGTPTDPERAATSTKLIVEGIALAFPSRIVLLGRKLKEIFPPNEPYKVGIIIGLLNAGSFKQTERPDPSLIPPFDEEVCSCLKTAIETARDYAINSTLIGNLSNAIGAYLKPTEHEGKWALYRRAIVLNLLRKTARKEAEMPYPEAFSRVLFEKLAIKYLACAPFDEKCVLIGAW